MEDIITFKELINKFNRGLSKDKIFKIVLKCMNCGLSDLLGKFILRTVWDDKEKVYWGSDEYKMYFYCPNCKSSMICLDKRSIKDILPHLL